MHNQHVMTNVSCTVTLLRHLLLRRHAPSHNRIYKTHETLLLSQHFEIIPSSAEQCALFDSFEEKLHHPMSDQPKRLQSLSSRGRGGRFVPKAVGRRSEKDRESSAPAIKHENDTPVRQPQKTERRRPKQMGTRGEAAGPLAAPAIVAPQRMQRLHGTRETAGRSESGAAPIGVKSEQELEKLHAQYIVGDDGRIDMTAPENTEAFFPLTVAVDPIEADRDHEPAHGETEAEVLLERESTAGSDVVELESDKLYLVQLPPLGLVSGPNPDYIDPPASKVKDEQPDELPLTETTMADSIAPTSEKSNITNANEETDILALGSCGRLGTLRKHRSGKQTLLIGDVVHELLPGTASSSVEDVLLVNAQERVARVLGSVNSKLLVVPDLTQLGL